MRSVLSSLLGFFLTPAGLVTLAALDASVVFFLPLGIDFVLVVMSARTPERFWLYALLATAGSVIGSAGTYWVGHTVGEHGLARWVGKRRLERVRRQVGEKTAAGVAVIGLIPPPFPFTAVVLAAGAFAIDRWRFFTSLAVARIIYYGIESALAARYGRRILVWMDSTAFEVVVGVLIVVAIAGTIVSAVKVFRHT